MRHEQHIRKWSSARGYTILELLLVVGIFCVVSAMAVLQMGTSREQMAGDAGMRVVLSQLNQARELAIAQRRFMRVTFTSPNLIRIIREDTTTTTTTLSNALMEGSVQFMLTSGQPDTPDAFGRTTNAVEFGIVDNIKFTPDGTLVNQDGQTTNGTVFIGIPSMPSSARAVTVLGSTGRVRGFRWFGSIWKLV